MDARDIKLEVLALQKLYGLLKSDGDGLANPAPNMLDDHARLILKHLLDSATQRALKVYSEILAGQVGVLRTPCASHMQQTDNTIKVQSSQLHMTREVDQSYDLGSDEERKANVIDFKLWKDQRLFRQRSRMDSVKQSTPSADATGAEFRKKRCRVCQRSTVKQMVTNDDTAKYSEISTYPQHEVNSHSDHVPWNIEQGTGSILRYKTNKSKTDKRRQIGPFVSNLSGVESTGFSSDTVVPDIATVCKSNFEAIYKGEEADSISKEASEAIEQLESCISNLKMGSDHVHLFGEFSGQHENVDSNDVVYKLTSQSAQSPLNYPSHQIYGVSTEVINQPLAKVQPKKCMFYQSNGHFSRSGGTYEMRESTEEPKVPVHGQNMKRIIDKIESGNLRMTHNEFGPNVWNVSVAADHETSPWPSTFSPVPKMESPDQIRLALKNERNVYGVFQSSKPANTFGNPNYSEKLQSIDSSSYGSLGGDYSFSDQTGSHYITSSTSGESGASPQSHGTTRDYDSCTSKSRDDPYSSTSGDGTPEVTSSGSGGSEGYSSYNQPMNRHEGSAHSSMMSASRKKVPGRLSKSISGINQKKPNKTWTRMKDRLGVIYHHHDHHHHHHDSHDDHRQGSHWKKLHVGTLFKKNEGKIIRSKQGDEVYGGRAVENMRKSLIHDKHQKGHFHGLVEAFLSHIWHSKKSKLAKGTSDKLVKNQRGGRKALKKSRLWELLQHHRRGNFSKKAHVKLGLGQKKNHLKAPRS